MVGDRGVIAVVTVVLGEYEVEKSKSVIIINVVSVQFFIAIRFQLRVQ